MEIQRYVMNVREIEALMSFKRNLYIDPLCIASNLADNACISKGLYEAIQKRLAAGIARAEITDFLIDSLPYHTTLEPFIRALDKCGYNNCLLNYSCIS